MNIEYNPKGKFNFHRSSSIKLRVSGAVVDDTFYVVSRGQAQRIREHYCGISDCVCSAGGLVQLDVRGDTWGIWRTYCLIGWGG